MVVIARDVVGVLRRGGDRRRAPPARARRARSATGSRVTPSPTCTCRWSPGIVVFAIGAKKTLAHPSLRAQLAARLRAVRRGRPVPARAERVQAPQHRLVQLPAARGRGDAGGPRAAGRARCPHCSRSGSSAAVDGVPDRLRGHALRRGARPHPALLLVPRLAALVPLGLATATRRLRPRPRRAAVVVPVRGAARRARGGARVRPAGSRAARRVRRRAGGHRRDAGRRRCAPRRCRRSAIDWLPVALVSAATLGDQPDRRPRARPLSRSWTRRPGRSAWWRAARRASWRWLTTSAPTARLVAFMQYLRVLDRRDDHAAPDRASCSRATTAGSAPGQPTLRRREGLADVAGVAVGGWFDRQPPALHGRLAAHADGRRRRGRARCTGRRVQRAGRCSSRPRSH